MKRIFLLLPLLWAFSACNDTFRPTDVLKEEDMAQLYTELQIAEAKVKNLRIPLDSARQLYAIIELRLFDEFEVEPETYRKSLTYYLQNSRAMGRINQAVVDTLTARQSALDTKMREQIDEVQADSVTVNQDSIAGGLPDASKIINKPKRLISRDTIITDRKGERRTRIKNRKLLKRPDSTIIQ